MIPSRARIHRALFLLPLCLGANAGLAQSLIPRAYIVTPVDGNAVTLSYSYQYGDVLFDPSAPIANTGSQLNVALMSYYHSFSFFGRSANVTAVLPYAVGTFSGTVLGVGQSIYRSGLTDSSFRLSANLKGGPAMNIEEFRNWRQKTLVGATFTVEVPTGQYDPARLVNPGTHRWAFRPELGLSRRFGSWVADAYGGAWFFAGNGKYFPGVSTVTQEPILGVELHLSYDVKPRLWLSLDGNFWYGGATSLNGVENVATVQNSSRIGATLSIPLAGPQSLKFSYSLPDHTSFGGNFRSLSAAWQYSWLGKP
jgi:hypothetical protein